MRGSLRTMSVDKLNWFESEMLLRTVAHYMDQPLRAKIMQTLPDMYNKWMDQEVMVTMRKAELEDLIPAVTLFR